MTHTSQPPLNTVYGALVEDLYDALEECGDDVDLAAWQGAVEALGDDIQVTPAQCQTYFDLMDANQVSFLSVLGSKHWESSPPSFLAQPPCRKRQSSYVGCTSHHPALFTDWSGVQGNPSCRARPSLWV